MVQAQTAAHVGQALRVGHVAEHQQRRVTGNQANQREHHHRNQQQGRYRHREFLQDKTQHDQAPRYWAARLTPHSRGLATGQEW
ncbi:hypothetical protein D3C73_1523980 [compost metagenome]